VPREDRYKAKNFIDTVVYRGGDAAFGWLFGALGSAIAFAAAAVSIGWTAIAFYLGARMKSWTRDDARSSPSWQPGR
jgi:AAA family ATP:ADP antiporter